MKNVAILEKQINHIFEQVYTLNESLSVYERRALVLGFEEGLNQIINEEFWRSKKDSDSGASGSIGNVAGNLWRGVKNIGSGIKKGYDTAVEKGKELYNQGKELAKKAWTSIKEFGAAVADGIKTAYNKSVDFVVTNYNNFKQALVEAWNTAGEEMKAAYETMKEKAAELGEAVRGIWANMMEKTREFVAKTKAKMIAAKDSIAEWIKSNKASIEKNIEEAQKSTIEGMNSLAKMAKDALNKAGKVALNIGAVALFICVWPIVKVIEGIKAIPGIYTVAVEATKNFLKAEIGKIKSEFEYASSDAEPVQGGDKVQSKYKELLANWKESQKASGKNANPGQGTRSRLMKQAKAELGVSENFRYLKTFENFNY
jgi:phage-related protein